MTSDQIQHALHTQPFRPFRLKLADHRELPESNPDTILHAPGARTCAVGQDNGTVEIVDLSLVVGIEIPPPARRRQAPEEPVRSGPSRVRDCRRRLAARPDQVPEHAEIET
jgi:hypothetical protein